MPLDSRNIVEVFDSLMTEIRVTIDPANGLIPFYEYGHPYDISSKLDEKSKSAYSVQMFPMICLLLDVSLEKGYNATIEYKASPTILILANTEASYHSDERLLNVFTPVLHPIYNALIAAMKNSRYIKSHIEGFSQTYTDRYYWGKLGIKLGANESPIFNQKLDGIEINFRDLEIYKYKNC